MKIVIIEVLHLVILKTIWIETQRNTGSRRQLERKKNANTKQSCKALLRNTQRITKQRRKNKLFEKIDGCLKRNVKIDRKFEMHVANAGLLIILSYI